MNLGINREFRSLQRFKDIEYDPFSSAHGVVREKVSVGNRVGVLELEAGPGMGEIRTLIIGGQELFLDDMCAYGSGE